MKRTVVVLLGRFFTEILTDANGVFSSKRTVTVICFFLIVLAFLLDLFTKLTVAEFMFNDLTYVVLVGLGATASEPLAFSLFGGRRNKSGEDGSNK